MIKHMVLLQFKSGITQEEINTIFFEIAQLKNVIPAMKSYTYGVNCSIEHLNKGFTHGFVMDFEDIIGRNDYVNHPEHNRVAQQVILPVLEHGFDSVIVFDYEF